MYDPNEIMALDINSRSKVKIVQPTQQELQAMQARGMTP